MRVRKVQVRLSLAQRLKKLKDLDLSYTLFLVFTTHPPPPPPPLKLFSWLLRCLDKSDGPRMDWYDSGIVRGGQDFKVDFKVDIKEDYRGASEST